MPSPPLDQSICWTMRGAVRESRISSGANSTIMSTVPQRVWTSPAAKASRADHRIVHQHHLDAEAVLLEEDAVVVGLGAVVGGDDRQPAGPDVVAEPEDLLVGVPLVLAGPLDRRAACRPGRTCIP